MIILDTDGGFDDIITLIVLLKKPCIEPISIILVNGLCNTKMSLVVLSYIVEKYNVYKKTIKFFETQHIDNADNADKNNTLSWYPEYIEKFNKFVKEYIIHVHPIVYSLNELQLCDTDTYICIGPLTNLVNTEYYKCNKVIWLGSSESSESSEFEYNQWYDTESAAQFLEFNRSKEYQIIQIEKCVPSTDIEYIINCVSNQLTDSFIKNIITIDNSSLQYDPIVLYYLDGHKSYNKDEYINYLLKVLKS